MERTTRCESFIAVRRPLAIDQPLVFADDVAGEASGFLVDVASEEVAEEAESAQYAEDRWQVDPDCAAEIRGCCGLRCHIECPAHASGNRDEMEEVHPACGRVHRHRQAVGADAPVVLDDQVAADRLDVDHAAPLLVSEHAGARWPRAQAW